MMNRKWILTTTLIFLFNANSASLADKTPITLREKIGQMIIIGFKQAGLKPNDVVVKAILAEQLGGIVLFDYDMQSKTFNHNIRNPQQLKKLVQQLQDYTNQAAKIHRNYLKPLLISIDYEGGQVSRLSEQMGFPKTFSAADIGRMTMPIAQKEIEKMVHTLQQAGINMNFTPVLDVNTNPENPIIGKKERSFSNNPRKVADYAAMISKIYHDNHIICVYKHFPGHGSSTGDTHAGFVNITQTWKPYELLPYKALISKPYHCPMIMMAHLVHFGLDREGYPASLSYEMTTQLLRKKLKYNGIIITDDLQMKAITDKYSLRETMRLAINAGANILVFGNQLVTVPQNPGEIIDMVVADVRAGKISIKHINDSYERIVKLKKTLVQH
jgi:beta-N-acetylhexosaminidase